jgi:type III secretion protein V
VYLLDPMIEDAVRDAIQRTSTGSYLAMPPDMARDVIGAVKRERDAAGAASSMLLLTQADVRRFVRRLVEVDMPDVSVLSYQELAPEVTVQPLGRVSVR